MQYNVRYTAQYTARYTVQYVVEYTVQYTLQCILHSIQRAAERRSRHRVWFNGEKPETIKNDVKTIDQNRLKINQKSTNNRPTIDQKSTKNQPTSTKNQPKIEVWKVLGQIWRRLGPAWAIQGVLRAILDRLGGVLEASWAVLGRERWPTWVQLGLQNAAKIDEKSVQKLINFMMPLGIDNFRFFSDFWNQKPSHVGSKMYSNIDLILKGVKAEKYCKTDISLIKNEVSGIEKSNKNQSKIDQKMKPRWG